MSRKTPTKRKLLWNEPNNRGRFQKKRKINDKCPGIPYNLIGDSTVSDVDSKKHWISNVKYKEAIEAVHTDPAGTLRACSEGATVCANNMCRVCGNYVDLLLFWETAAMRSWTEIYRNKSDQLQSIHVRLNVENETIYLSNINRSLQTSSHPILNVRWNVDGMQIEMNPNLVVYQSKAECVPTVKSAWKQLATYITDDVHYCHGFRCLKHQTVAQYGNTFETAVWLPNQLVRHRLCKGIIAAKKGSKLQRICGHCSSLKSLFQTAKSAKPNYVPSKHASFRKLPLQHQISLHSNQSNELLKVQRKYERLKRCLSQQDDITIKHQQTNKELYSLCQYVYKHFDDLNDAVKHKPLLCQFLKDQLKSAVVDNKESVHSSKGMRWSMATYQFAMHVAARGGSKAMSRINNLNLIKLPSDQMLKYKRYDFQNGQGVDRKLLNNLTESLTAHRHKCGRDGPSYLCLKFDEIYVKNGIVYNPKSNQIIGITTELESGDYLQPMFDLVDAVNNDRNADAKAMQIYSAKIAVQVILSDLASNWNYVGPYWLFHRNAVATQLYNCLIMKFLLPLHLLNLDIKVMMSDMSSTNLSFVQLLSGVGTSKELIGSAILVRLPFYDDPFVFMFDPHHLLKALRNVLYRSTFKEFNVKYQCYPLQDLAEPITWEHIEFLHNEDLDADLVRYRTLTSSSVFLNAYSKQSVALALDIFSENLVSGMQYQLEKSDGNHSLRSTLKYLKMGRQLLVGTFVSCGKADGKYDKITGPQNAMLPRIQAAWNRFSEFQTVNEHSNLSTKTFLSVSALCWGFEWICYDWENTYEQIAEEHKPYLCPYRLTTNDVELFFSKQRGRNCDRADVYGKGVAISRMEQNERLETSTTTNTASRTHASARQYQRRQNQEK